MKFDPRRKIIEKDGNISIESLFSLEDQCKGFCFTYRKIDSVFDKFSSSWTESLGIDLPNMGNLVAN